MGEIRITDSLTGKKLPLVPVHTGEIRMYVCGVTVYDRVHLGHARSALVFDLAFRFFQHRGFGVTYAKNFTDIDDKIIQRAKAEGRSWKEVADIFIASYERDMARLGVLSPTIAPKATDHVREMIEMTRRLLEQGFAYRAGGDVYFQVERFPDYGRLSGKCLEELLAGARVEVDERKKNPLDFALWKAAKPDEPSWESPWGPGRPGWHIECSAMAVKHLGETLDLHGGGEDLIFPHHENERAQSEAATGKPFVRLWVHNGFVTINREKMSKSLGSFFTVEEIFEKSKQLFGILNDRKAAEIIRYFLLSAHYRSPIDFSDESIREAKAALDNFYLLLFEMEKISKAPSAPASGDFHIAQRLERIQGEIESTLEEDLNAPAAFGRLQSFRAEINRISIRLVPDDAAGILRFFTNVAGSLFGIFQCSPEREWGIMELSEGVSLDEQLLPRRAQARIAERNEARRAKNWALADQIRDELLKQGLVLEDRPGGTTRVIYG